MAKTESPARRIKSAKPAMKKAAKDQITAKMPGKPNPDMMPKADAPKPPTKPERLNFQKVQTAQKKRRKRNVGRS